MMIMGGGGGGGKGRVKLFVVDTHSHQRDGKCVFQRTENSDKFRFFHQGHVLGLEFLQSPSIGGGGGVSRSVGIESKLNGVGISLRN